MCPQTTHAQWLCSVHGTHRTRTHAPTQREHFRSFRSSHWMYLQPGAGFFVVEVSMFRGGFHIFRREKQPIVNKYCNKYYRLLNKFFFVLFTLRSVRFGSSECVDTDPFNFLCTFCMFTHYLPFSDGFFYYFSSPHILLSLFSHNWWNTRMYGAVELLEVSPCGVE